MLAIEIAGFGGPEALRPVDRPVAEPGLNEVRVRVHAAGVNRPDLMQRQGKYPPPPGASDIPGLELAGIIESVGPILEGEPSRWAPGDSVCALVAGGGYAECAIAPSPQCLPVPTGMTPVSAAAVPETYFTVWTNVFQRGQLATGETILIHGGSSGIGTTAIQLARAFGATVYVTAGTDDKCRACEHLGAEAAINYKTSDFVDVVSQLTSGRGVNVILDMVGGDYLERNLKALAVDGRLIQIGLQGGSRSNIDLRLVMQRRLTLTGSTLRNRSVAEKAAIARDLEKHVWPLLASGTVKPIIDRTLPLEQAAEAHRLLESGEVVGKIVLTVGWDLILVGPGLGTRSSEGVGETLDSDLCSVSLMPFRAPSPEPESRPPLPIERITISQQTALAHANSARGIRVPGAMSRGSAVQRSDCREMTARAATPTAATAGPAGDATRSMRPPAAQVVATTPCTTSSIHAAGPRTPIDGNAVRSSMANVPGAQMSR